VDTVPRWRDAPIGSEDAVRKSLCQMDIDRGCSLPLPCSKMTRPEARQEEETCTVPGDRHHVHRNNCQKRRNRPNEIPKGVYGARGWLSGRNV
jgi:hypothetical protein